ncbi:MAG TPA: FHA domain-containing protein [Anaerolineae bacterium]|nr:FHA domain-containing protein [Anaerolineae bacterium]
MKEDKRTLIDEPAPRADYDNKKTVPDGGRSTPVSDSAFGGSEGKTLVDGNPFQPTHPHSHPTPPGGTPYYGYPPPPPPTPPQGVPLATGGAKTVIMDSQTPPEDIPLAWLGVVDGPGGRRGQTFLLGRDAVVGRDPGDIMLTDRAASGRHLRIRLEASEQPPQQQVFVIYDQGSTNGTYVGSYTTCQDAKTSGDPKARAYRHVLRDGDFILIGQTILVFKQVDL